MKKFWLVLLSLGLVMAFSVSAFAVDVKVSAEYYAAGLYLNKTSVADIEGLRVQQDGREYLSNPSTAFYFQRLRMGTDFIVSPCLKLVTRFDAMERIWGGARTPGYGGGDSDDYYEANSAGTRAENENIAFDLVYIDYTAPIGQFQVGYQPDYVWGTIFGDRGNGNPAGQINYTKLIGPVTLKIGYAKEADNSYSAVRSYEMHTDQDADSYRLGAIYNFKNNQVAGEAGALLVYDRDATKRPGFGTPAFSSQIYSITPYVKTKIGPVNLQAELSYFWGNAFKQEPDPGGPDDMWLANVNVDAWRVFLDAGANFGIFNVGGSFAYISGDDPGTTDKVEGSAYIRGPVFTNINSAGLDWNPCLILFNNDLRYWTGPLNGHSDSVFNSEMYNAWFFQGRIGVKPTSQLAVDLLLSYAMADKKPADDEYAPRYANGSYGFEVDIVGTYKITNNLSYMLGAGYLFTGDYFKGYDDGNGPGTPETVDNFILINKLTLTF
jgi:hypothetical protein